MHIWRDRILRPTPPLFQISGSFPFWPCHQWILWNSCIGLATTLNSYSPFSWILHIFLQLQMLSCKNSLLLHILTPYYYSWIITQRCSDLKQRSSSKKLCVWSWSHCANKTTVWYSFSIINSPSKWGSLCPKNRLAAVAHFFDLHFLSKYQHLDLQCGTSIKNTKDHTAAFLIYTEQSLGKHGS